MLLLWSSLKHLPVASKDGKYGIIKDIVVDPETSVVLAFEVKTGWFQKDKFLSYHDILDFDPEAVVIRSIDSLVDLNDIVRAEKIKKQKIKVVRAKAYTESKKFLGWVFDLAISSETGLVAKYYLRDLFFNERIISKQRIIKINQSGVIVENDAAAILQVKGAESHG